MYREGKRERVRGRREEGGGKREGRGREEGGKRGMEVNDGRWRSRSKTGCQLSGLID